MSQKIIKINDTLSVSYDEGEGIACTPVSNILLCYDRGDYHATAQIFENNLDFLEEYTPQKMLEEILEQSIDYIRYLQEKLKTKKRDHKKIRITKIKENISRNEIYLWWRLEGESSMSEAHSLHIDNNNCIIGKCNCSTHSSAIGEDLILVSKNDIISFLDDHSKMELLQKIF